MADTLAIVIPALNEQGRIAELVESLRRQRGSHPWLETPLVVDGGSRDATVSEAKRAGARTLVADPGRARQMNAGAAATRSEWLWFLHADTRLPAGSLSALQRCLAAGRDWGRFDVRIQGDHWMLPVIATSMNARSRLTGIATGDQGIFVRRRVFDAVGGYPEQPLMEDIALCRRLKDAVGRPACLRESLHTSGRRWESHGVWRTMALMWQLRWAYWRGADPEHLASRYHSRGS
ncbi:TIGR04283 family arsenosugar biosynthesis glycosyltransferase [Spiribacter sp. 2438]|uniref:TIGR04283 family arsenosugar biosynthesis glycosyltransferase n=1 Tax=Spiribacter sp. 2438 TaxID=2666185 RepID=UPI001E592A4F|nr:TIGR04283 family arsenosugar biosynthesis glycosyltransferase [Spiribacter sp. 2438]